MKKATLIAVGVFAVLLGVVLATRDRGNVNVGMPKLALRALDKDKVTSIEVSGSHRATLKKEGRDWSVLDPAKGSTPRPADSSQVGNLLEQLAQLKAADFVTEKPERHAELEIDSAKGLVMKVQSEAGPGLEVVFGKASKTGGVYLRGVASDQVFVSNSSVPWMLRREPNGWRKRSFFPARIDELTKVTVTLEDGSTTPLEVGTDGKWALAAGTPSPKDFRFDPEAARQVALNLASLSAADFADDGSAEALGLAGPHPTIQAQLKDGKSITVHLAGGVQPAAGNVALRLDGDPQLYLLPPHQAEGLKKRVADLRDTTLLSFEPDRVKAVTIVAAGKKTALAKEAGGAWKILEPKKLPAEFELEPSQVAQFLSGLKTLRAARAVDAVTDAQAGLAKPGTVIELAVEGAPAQVLKFGSEVVTNDGPKQVYVKGSADALTYAIFSSHRERFDTGLELFKKPPPRPSFGQGGQIQGLENLPPEVRRQLEAQLRQPH